MVLTVPRPRRCASPDRAPRLRPLLLVLLLAAATLTVLPGPTAGTTAHAPIYIDGDAAFASKAASEGWPGSGTAQDPYIIEGYAISATSTNGIQILNTRAHFIVRDNVITGSGSTYGIYLTNVQYGIIESNTFQSVLIGVFFNAVADCEANGNDISGTIYGLAIISSFRNGFDGNVINGTRYGYYMLHSHGNTFEGNEAYNSTSRGIYIHNGEGNTFIDTTIVGASEKAVHLLSTSGNVLSGTTIRNTPLGVHYDGNGNNRVDNSTIDGVPAAILVSGVHDAVIVDNHINGSSTAIDLQQADRATLDGNTVTNTTLAYNLFFADDTTARGGTLRNVTTGFLSFSILRATIEDIIIEESGIGIHLRSSRLSTIRGLEATGNDQAVRIENSRDNTVEESEFFSNTYAVTFSRGLKMEVRHTRFVGNDVGLRLLDSDQNLIWDNTFVNDLDVEITGDVTQTWAVEKTPGRNIVGGRFLGGNFWDNYRGTDLDLDGLGEIPHSPFMYGRLGSAEAAEATGWAYGPDDPRPLVQGRFHLP